MLQFTELKIISIKTKMIKQLSELKLLANQYKNTAYAEKIVLAAKPIFMKKGDVAGYERFARNRRCKS